MTYSAKIMHKDRTRLDTKVVHSGDDEARIEGAVVPPIFQTAQYLIAGETEYRDLRYIRLNNTPNHLALHKKLAALEKGESALVTASGMAAISASILTVLNSGDHMISQDTLYGGTHTFLTHDFASLNRSYTFVDLDRPKTWESALRPETRAMYVETMTNPLLQVGNLKAVVDFAKSHDLITLIDNTFASPVNFNPLEFGFDLSLHSATKYLNGHSDIVAGCVIGRTSMIKKITDRMNHLGGSLDPHAVFLFNRGLKTLCLRINRHNESALRLARFLEKHSAVSKVNYPGLESHPHHGRAKEYFRGFGGMMSFELKGNVQETEAFMKRLRIPLLAPSLGGVESLVNRPSKSSHLGLTAEERAKLGISDKLVRFSVGIEATEDLIEDFEQALG